MRSDLRRTSATTLAAAVATALLLGTAGTPAQAADAPAPSPVSIGPAVTDDQQRGIFHVAAWTDVPGVTVTKVAVTIRKGDTVVAEIPSLPEYSWVKGRFGLTSADPLKLTEDGGTLPALGRYSLDVTATDSQGNTGTRTDAGTLDFTLKPQLEFGLSTPGWDDRTTVPSGTLTGVQPGSGDLVPITGRSVDIRRITPEAGPVQSAVTTETGAFTGQAYTVARPGDDFRVAFAEESEEVHGSVAYTHTLYSVRPHTVSVQATADRVRVLPGQQAVVTGRMTDPQNGGTPLAGQQVQVGPSWYSTLMSGFAKTVTTDADGRFTATIPALPGLRVDSWAAVPVDPYQSFGTAVGGRLVMPQEARIILGSRVLTNEGKVTATGTLRATYDAEAYFDEPLYLEVSPDGRTGWRRIALSTASNYYATTMTAASRGGYYRFRHPETDVFAGTTSAVFRLARTEARVIGLNAGPEPVAKGGTLTTTATLQHYTGGAWRAYGNGAVALQFLAKGSTTWRNVATGRSASTGKVTLKAKATVDGSWRIRYWGDATHFHAPVAAPDYVDVR
ncbi:hypothetical protein AB0424_22225 [Streptomyces sp. NPDC051180]|uniref:hypothetical protein n=1 Tax=Streptomyces sp. NPDC051180 TaxID=3155797 RepID=UPI003450D1F3